MPSGIPPKNVFISTDCNPQKAKLSTGNPQIIKKTGVCGFKLLLLPKSAGKAICAVIVIGKVKKFTIYPQSFNRLKTVPFYPKPERKSTDNISPKSH